MAGRQYERLPIEVFGRQLITSGDLDPVYIALRELDWAPAQVNRWLIAYWCFYHCGFASYASEFTGGQFWDALQMAAANETTPPPGGRWPRGQERRHARGAQGLNMVRDLRERYGDDTDGMINMLVFPSKKVGAYKIPFTELAERAKEHTLFGPWMAFKIGDMVERVLGVPVSFDNAAVFMFKDPMRAAEMLYCQKAGLDPKRVVRVNFDVNDVVDYLVNTFDDLTAPPTYDRAIGLQEVETVLCKWKSHMNGHYPLNNDIDEINEGLEGWGRSAREFAGKMPRRVDG